MSTYLICVNACVMSFSAYTNAAYFTLRSGGQTLITFLFDSCFVWVIRIPVAYCPSRFTGLTSVPLFAICLSLNLIQCAIGAFVIQRGNGYKI